MGDLCRSIGPADYAEQLAKVLDLTTSAKDFGASGEARIVEADFGEVSLWWGRRSSEVSFCLAEIPDGTQFAEPHNHETQEETLFGLEGEMDIEIEGKTRTIGPGDILVIPAGVPHQPLRYRGVSVASGRCVTTQVARFRRGLIGGLNGHEGII